MTTLTTAPATAPITRLVTIVPDASRRGRIKAAGFGALTYFGLSFAQALVVPGDLLVLGQLAALVLGMVAAGRLVGARDRTEWLSAIGSVIAAVLVFGLAMWAIVGSVVMGPFAP